MLSVSPVIPWLVSCALPWAVAGDDVDYATEIAPIFEARCTSCHGSEKSKAGLRLDSARGALRGADSGGTIVPGDRAGSGIVQRVTAEDELDRMPPDGPSLAAREIELLGRWIDAGAPVGTAEPEVARHWSLAPVASTAPPAVSGEWARGPIDAFVLAGLERHGVAPSQSASRAQLLRRLSMDLLGLPPSAAELSAFLADDGDDAYERVVERLLASPHFGERWARPWLDLARYADSDGYEKDTLRPNAWRWREWVIDAINRDVPYDRFVIEQLAGDLLPDATPEQHLATGFHRNTLTNKEGGADQEEFRIAAVSDRVDTTGSVFLGLTIGCARCHSHKYDDLTQREYYELFAFFNSDDEVQVDVPPSQGERDAWDAARWAQQERVLELEALEALGPGGVAWEPLDPVTFLAEGGSTLTEESDRSLRASGLSPRTERYSVVFDSSLEGITALRLEVFPGSAKKLVGRPSHGNFVLSEIEVNVAPRTVPGESRRVVLDSAWADHSQGNWPVAGAIDGDTRTGWALQPHYAVPHTAVFVAAEAFGGASGSTVRVDLSQQYGSQHTIAHFRLSATTADPRLVTLQAELEALRASSPVSPTARGRTLALRAEPRATHVLLRGSFLDHGEAVEPGTPACLPALRARGADSPRAPDRLDLARWIASPDNPLTARVEANRIWSLLFGRGLVVTAADFGTQGAPPTHAALLDWLADAFIDGGWSRKALVRTVVSSATYRQSSRVRPDLGARDPANAWLARQSSFRLDAELVRDRALAVSGLLSRTIGGPSVRPPLPADVAELGYAGSVRWQVSDGAERYRRGLYILLQRTVPYPMLVAFDCADPSVSTARRERSNTPLQALTTLNDPVFVECARAFARSLIGSGLTDDERIDTAVRHAFCREPRAAEREVLARLLESQRARYAPDVEAASLFAGAPADADVVELAAWTAVCRALMNTDEFLTRD